jgi:general secretion pathway protein G
VVGIITVLMGSAIFMLTGNLEFAKEQRARGDINAIVTQVRMYEMKSGGVPLSQSQGLQALVGKGQGFEELPKDPWGEDYQYKVDSSSAKGFKVYSKGPDRQDNSGGGDDVTSK